MNLLEQKNQQISPQSLKKSPFHLAFKVFTQGLVAALAIAGTNSHALAENPGDEEMAKKLANPVASLISVPLDYDYNRGIGPLDDGTRSSLTAKPVLPFSLSPKLNLITRNIIPFVTQEHLFPGSGTQTGLGDIQSSYFLSPAEPVSGFILGAGPVLQIPTASEKLLGSGKWGLGPTMVALQQQGAWTWGTLANHLWSVGGDGGREAVSSTFLQPFLAYNTKTASTFTLQSESTYNWRRDRWSIPVSLQLAQILRAGSQLIQLRAGIRYMAQSDDFDPEGLGFRAGLVFLFPK